MTTEAPAHPSMSATATLTNCYVPLPAVNSTTNNNSISADYDPYARPNNDNRHDNTSLHPSQPKSTTSTSTTTRGPRTLRQLHLAKSILSQSTGSALVELGHTKVMVSVRGPRPIACSSMSNSSSNNNSILQCQVRYMPHVGIRMATLANHSLAHDFSSTTTSTSSGGGGARIPRDAISSAQDTSNLLGGSVCAPTAFLDETYLSRRLYEALLPSVMADDDIGNKMCVEVFVQVLQSDGGVFGAAVMGASLALADAGVRMRDLVCASSAAVMMKTDDDGGGKKKKKK
eukprot:scaffold37798_cov194-Skeletonema_dohrnii-CCMP3373.AAC.2